jgi:hypothetical protein
VKNKRVKKVQEEAEMEDEIDEEVQPSKRRRIAKVGLISTFFVHIYADSQNHAWN